MVYVFLGHMAAATEMAETAEAAFFVQQLSTISWHISHSSWLKKQTFFSLTRSA